ncbi:MAG TPA: hydrogenase maturation protease [Roseiflexaceae bacterium]|nr:hydrogenase maturation protease [Roseiflexaceae bacterium]
MPVLIACVGYRFLRDLSVGPELAPALGRLDWPADVEVCDLHFGPIHMVHWLEERPGYYGRIVFVAAVERGRERGRVYCYRWDGALPGAEEIQRRVEEAVTGVISLDNLLIVGRHFGALPPDVVVVEVEPEDTGWGPGLSVRVEEALPAVIEAVRRAALGGGAYG